MKSATLTTTSGYTWSTSINGTVESINEYFYMNEFNVGKFPDESTEVVTDVKIYGEDGQCIYATPLNLFRDFYNNYLTATKMADDYNMGVETVKKLYNEGKKVHNVIVQHLNIYKKHIGVCD